SAGGYSPYTRCHRTRSSGMARSAGREPPVVAASRRGQDGFRASRPRLQAAPSARVEAAAALAVDEAGGLCHLLAEQAGEEHAVEGASRAALAGDAAEDAVRGLDCTVIGEDGLVPELVEDPHDLRLALDARL